MPQQGPYVIFVNGRRFEVALSSLTGSQIRALVGADLEWHLICEGHGDNPDQMLGDDEKVSLEQGPVRFFLSPPATFG